MCEIYGFCGAEAQNQDQRLREFFSHSAAHPHGWGLAVNQENGLNIEKEPVKASASPYLKYRLSAGIRTNLVLGHIRYATIGNVGYENCHPYTRRDGRGRNWTLVHNGTIFSYDPLNSYLHRQRGETDSERILLYLVDAVNDESKRAGKALKASERFAVVSRLIGDMAEGNKLNLLIWDGELLYVHTNAEGTLYHRQEEKAVCISTQALEPSGWEPVPPMTVLAYRGGQPAFAGECHGHAYVETEENLKFLYQIFSSL